MDVDPIIQKVLLNLTLMIFLLKCYSENGYTGNSDEDIVNALSNDLCRTILQQELADMDFGLEQDSRQPQTLLK